MSASRSCYASAIASARPAQRVSPYRQVLTTTPGVAGARNGNPMDLDLTSEQELLRESVRRTCERHCGVDVVRKLENDPIGYSPALWSALGELGLHGLTIPEDR